MWVLSFPRINRAIIRNQTQYFRFSRARTSSSQAAIATITSSDDDDYARTNSFEAAGFLDSLRHDPRTALAYFRHLTQQGFKHDVTTYAALVKILCISGFSDTLVSVFSDIIAQNTVEINDLLQALTEEQNHPTYISIRRAYNALIRSYVKSGKFDEAVGVLFQTGRRGFVPDVLTGNFLIDRLIRHGKVDMSLSLYKLLKNTLGFEPNTDTYSIVANAHFRKGRLEDAAEFLEDLYNDGIPLDAGFCLTFIRGLCNNHRSDLGYRMLHEWIGKFPIDTHAYSAVIRGFCLEMNFDMAEQVFSDMEKQGILPNDQCYHHLIEGYCKVANLEILYSKVLIYHYDMLSKGLKTNCFTVSHILQCMSRLGLYREVVQMFSEIESLRFFIDKVLYNILICALCHIGKVEEAQEVVDNMKAKKMNLDVILYTTLIDGYCLRGEVFNAWKVFEEVEKVGLKSDIVTYNVLLKGFSISGQYSEVHKLLERMKAQDLQPIEATHNTIIENLCVGGKVKEARNYFGHLEEKSLRNYAALMNGYCKANLLKNAYGIFDSLNSIERHDSVYKSSCCNLFTNLCKIGDTDKAYALLTRMVELYMEPFKFMYRNLILNFCRDGDMKTARSVFNGLLKSVTPDVYTYTIMINGYCRKYKFQEAHELFQDMKTKNVTPDIVTYTVLLNGHAKTTQNQRQGGSPTNASGDTEEISFNDIFAEVFEMGLELDVKFYTVLIDMFCKNGQLDEAISLFNDMVGKGIEADIYTYTILMYAWVIKGDMEMAKSLIDEMSSKGMQVDGRTSSIVDHAQKISSIRKSMRN